MSAMYFDAKVAPRLWDADDELGIAELSRRFPQWTFLPILPAREQTLRSCIREGIKDGLWAVVYGDKATTTYRKLIEKPEEFDALSNLFDGASFLVRGDLLRLLREELGVAGPQGDEPTQKSAGATVEAPKPPVVPVPAPTKRYVRVRLTMPQLPVVKTPNLQPYLWKVLQEADPGTTLSLSVEVVCPAGVPEDMLEKRIVEGFEQLGITVQWEQG
jgi:hypothetical protein